MSCHSVSNIGYVHCHVRPCILTDIKNRLYSKSMYTTRERACKRVKQFSHQKYYSLCSRFNYVFLSLNYSISSRFNYVFLPFDFVCLLLPPQGFRPGAKSRGGTRGTRAYIKDSTYGSNIQSVY